MAADRLDEELHDLGRHLDVPAAPDMAAAVRDSLSGDTVRVLSGDTVRVARPIPLRYRLLHLPRPVQAAAALLLLFGVLIGVSPDVRATAVDVLRFAGIEIHEEGSPVPVPPIASPLPGEESVSLADARAAVGFEVIVPAGLGEPDAVTLADDRVVSLLYNARGTRPAILIDEFGGSIDPTFQKYAVERAEPVQIGNFQGIWIGRPHPLLYVDRSGQPQEEAARMAGRTLIWQIGGTVFRMEGEFTQQQAVEIARSTLRGPGA